MSNEARVTGSLRIRKGNTDYQSRPTAFAADVAGTKGPSPGTITITTTGTDINLSQVGLPGLCYIQNLDETNYVVVGVYDGTSFFPLLELLPGEGYPLRLYRYIGTEFIGTGTPADVNTLRIKAFVAPCLVKVECFER